MNDPLLPSEYTGELLCIRCGAGFETGNHYVICADGFSHDLTCAVYNYSYDTLCDKCEAHYAEVGWD